MQRVEDATGPFYTETHLPTLGLHYLPTLIISPLSAYLWTQAATHGCSYCPLWLTVSDLSPNKGVLSGHSGWAKWNRFSSENKWMGSQRQNKVLPPCSSPSKEMPNPRKTKVTNMVKIIAALEGMGRKRESILLLDLIHFYQNSQWGKSFQIQPHANKQFCFTVQQPSVCFLATHPVWTEAPQRGHLI